MSNLKRNALYNTVYQIIRIIFPLITYPYISRILGPQGIGKVSYAQTFAGYFTNFALLGLPAYAVREISRSRAYSGQLEKNTGEFLSLSFYLSLSAFLLYVLSLFVLPTVAPEPILHWIFALTVLFNWAQIDWFFQGIENYKYITTRNLFLRVISIVGIFLIIKSKDQYTVYGAIWALSTILSSFWNVWYCYRLVHPRWSMDSWKHHLKNSIPTAFLSFSGFIYSSIDTIMLGVMIPDQKYSVGIYNVSGRIIRITMSILGGLNAVLTPRLAYIHEKGDSERMELILRKIFTFTLYVTIPATIGLSMVADDVILLFAGSKFRESILTLRILSIEFVFLGLTGILSQLLYSTRKEKQLLWINLVSLSVAILTNRFAIPMYKQDGAALATLFTRFLQSCLLLCATLSIVRKVVDVRSYIHIGLVNLFLGILIACMKTLCLSLTPLSRLLITVLTSIIGYVLFSWVLRIEPFLLVKDWMLQRVFKTRSGL